MGGGSLEHIKKRIKKGPVGANVQNPLVKISQCSVNKPLKSNFLWKNKISLSFLFGMPTLQTGTFYDIAHMELQPINSSAKYVITTLLPTSSATYPPLEL